MDNHEMYRRKESRPKFIGVNNLINRYRIPFDAEKVANRIAEGKGTTPDALLEDWEIKRKAAVERGILTHKYIENRLNHHNGDGDYWAYKSDVHTPVPPQASHYCHRWEEWILKRENQKYRKVAVEMPIRDTEYMVSGKIDYVADVHNTNTRALIDWKTANKYRLRNIHQHYLSPLSHLQDCEHTNYSLQLHIYAQLLARKEPKVQREYELFNVNLAVVDERQRFDALPLHDVAAWILEQRRREVSPLPFSNEEQVTKTLKRINNYETRKK